MRSLLIITLMLLAPALSLAQGGLVQCGNPGQNPCTFCDIWSLLDRVVKLLIEIAFVAGAIGIVVGGFFIMTAGGSENNVTKGRGIITTAVIGIVIVLVTWVVLNTIFQFFAKGVGGWDPRFWNTIQCSVSPAPAPAGPAPNPNTIQSPATAPASEFLSAQDARARLQHAGIAVNKGECPVGVAYQEVAGGCTSLQGIRASTIAGAIELKRDCDCSVVVTGGTELGHAQGPESHASGAKLDFQRNAALDRYIENTYRFIGTRSDGAKQYRAPNGTVFAKEHDHWDVKGWEGTFSEK